MNTAQLHYDRAKKVLPGGLTASARFNKYLNRPFFVSRADGSRLYDLDGTEFIDMFTSAGASLLGHGHPKIRAALHRAAEMGVACAMEYEAQVELAERICAAIPSAEMVRFTLSGTETTMYAVRLARYATGRRKVIKIEGHFHGFNDYLQFNYWPQANRCLPEVSPETPGFPLESKDQVIVVPFNDIAAIEKVVTAHGPDIAAMILEPVNFNSGGICPNEGYLQALRTITTRHGIVLIFDEVLAGFRTGIDCMQGHFGVTPDMTTFGKAIGGGTPISAFAGKREIMRHIAPEGSFMHSGTYNANTTSILCGLAFFELMSERGQYTELLRRSQTLYRGLNDAFASAGLAALANGMGARFGLLFGPAAAKAPVAYPDVMNQDWDLGHAFFREAHDRGVYFNRGWHHGLSIVHTDQDVARVIELCGEAARAVMAR